MARDRDDIDDRDDVDDRPARRRGGDGPRENIPNYLVQSILVTLCCCLPFGIVAILQSAKVNTLVQSGDYAGAKEASNAAYKYGMIGAIGGLVVGVAYVALNFVILANNPNLGK